MRPVFVISLLTLQVVFGNVDQNEFDEEQEAPPPPPGAPPQIFCSRYYWDTGDVMQGCLAKYKVGQATYDQHMEKPQEKMLEEMTELYWCTAEKSGVVDAAGNPQVAVAQNIIREHTKYNPYQAKELYGYVKKCSAEMDKFKEYIGEEKLSKMIFFRDCMFTNCMETMEEAHTKFQLGGNY